MIDENILKNDLLVNVHKEHFKDYQTGAKGTYYSQKDVFDCINNQPKTGGWIPCSERLPEKGVMNPITNDYVEYLCTVCVDGFRTIRLIKFDTDGCWVNHGMNFDKYVTAWQPLPEAYHG